MNIVDRISSNTSPEIDVYDEEGPYQAFGVSRRAFGGESLIDFITRDGNHHALTYSHLYDITFNPSTGIEISFSDHVVTLKGRCLKQGYEQLLRQRIVWISEAIESQGRLLGDGQPVVSEIRIVAKQLSLH